ncbi:MAG: TonB-dependent receptor plug domain-containing protein [Phenylobacterium sp.]|uniref:TonB-dependent receptor plug domain-containing protein n=1 Tax=Phenylobacterium sp. TaxID=1871053 RepID=UPI00391A986E
MKLVSQGPGDGRAARRHRRRRRRAGERDRHHQEDIRRRFASDLADILEGAPGVTVGGAGVTRRSVSIRGMPAARRRTRPSPACSRFPRAARASSP